MGRHVVALAAAWAIWTTAPAAADPSEDPGDVQTQGRLARQRPRWTPNSPRWSSRYPGMRMIDPTITDNGGRMVCAYLDRHSREDTEAALLGDNPTFTPAEAHAFVIDAEQVYCPSHIRQTIG